ncbi:dual specificity protein phosphatase family protein [Synechococcus sp. PCC 6312]|uniref:protein-tyrosine phosphatase family protein n=1 Tax=Synechococcus sp. (strain ATCC 27167 / PCC 6312) TaxID=195253 RepID=UPI00029F2CD1|nr:dual specificity protein phosphatase [Synechococcus sp. PCC 6312]AFY61362.1 putative protein-tyrosine phosphatase [Synechococcus sp. PCC 6312]
MPERFSWILPNQLAVGSVPNASASTFYLRRVGITAVLTLTEATEIELPKDLSSNFLWQRVPIPDGFKGGVPEVEQFAQAMAILQQWFKKQHTVYVHCLAGVGRSASVCALYLTQSQNLPLEAAIAEVKRCHSYAHPDHHQVRVMQAYLQAQQVNS